MQTKSWNEGVSSQLAAGCTKDEQNLIFVSVVGYKVKCIFFITILNKSFFFCKLLGDEFSVFIKILIYNMIDTLYNFIVEFQISSLLRIIYGITIPAVAATQAYLVLSRISIIIYRILFYRTSLLYMCVTQCMWYGPTPMFME